MPYFVVEHEYRLTKSVVLNAKDEDTALAIARKYEDELGWETSELTYDDENVWDAEEWIDRNAYDGDELQSRRYKE